MHQYISNKSLFERAQLSIPGGVNSPVPYTLKVWVALPIFIKSANC